MKAVFGSLLSRWSLRQEGPQDFARRLPVRWPGDPRRGEAILGGEYRFAGQSLRDPKPLWLPAGATPEWLATLHGFAWLADVAALDSPEGRAAGAALIADWLARNRKRSPLPWRPDVLAARLLNWVIYADEFCAGPERAEQRRAMLAGLARQFRLLERAAGREGAGSERIGVLRAAILVGLALGAESGRVRRVLRRLDKEIALQILADGGNAERSPKVQLTVLRDLVDIRTALRAAQMPVPEGVQRTVDRVAPMLRFFRHGDGRLAQFNGTSEEFGGIVDLVLARAEACGGMPEAVPASGFQRLQAGKTVVLIDAGAPPRPDFDARAHAGTLSFEMSHGTDRIVVNCGAAPDTGSKWQEAARSTAAHSTLVVADTNSSEILAKGGLGRRPRRVTCERAEEAGRQWVVASHDGYARKFGLTHTRQLFLSADGTDLRGEDSLSGRRCAVFVIRFHFHPAVEVSIADGGTALLQVADRSSWRLLA
jgi:uncharacterized heparinase superfamily protein